MAKVRLSNGTVVDTDQLNWSPSAGGGTMYDATRLGAAPFSPPPVPAPMGGLTTRKVSTVPVDASGNPIAQSPRSPVGYGADWNNLTGMLAGAWGNTPRTAMLPYPEDSRTAPPLVPPVNDPFKTFNPNADQSRLPPNDGGEAGFMAAFYPNAQNPAVSAIDQATGVPTPRARPDLVMPMMPSPLLRAPAIPGPRNSSTPTGGNYTVKRGDTVWDLARKNNTTVNAIAIANGLRDPSKIKAGQQLTIPSVPAPRMRPPAMSKKPSGPPAGMTVDEVGAFRYHG